MNRGNSRNTIPVEPLLLPSACGRCHCTPRSSSKQLHTSVCQITSIKISTQIMLGSPEITGMPAYDCRPIATTLYRNTSVSQSKISLRISLRTESFIRKKSCHLLFLCIGKLRYIFRFLARSNC